MVGVARPFRPFIGRRRQLQMGRVVHDRDNWIWDYSATMDLTGRSAGAPPTVREAFYGTSIVPHRDTHLVLHVDVCHPLLDFVEFRRRRWFHEF